MAKLTDYSKWDNLEDSDEEEVADRVRSCSPFQIEHGSLWCGQPVDALPRLDAVCVFSLYCVPRDSDAPPPPAWIRGERSSDKVGARSSRAGYRHRRRRLAG